MSSQDFVKLALQMTTMLGFAVIFGEIMRRFKQPAVVGEMFGGIVLGPTVFGWLAPALYEWLFLSSANVTVVREASTKLGMLFFLFYAGLEVNLAELKALGKKAILIGLVGTLLPIAAGVALVYALPRSFWGPAVQGHFLSFALFVGMNLANSANPVIARILMDLGLLNAPIGALIMSATIVDDLVNWALFAIILSDIAPSSAAAGGSLTTSLLLVGLLFVVVLGVARRLGPSVLTWLQPHVSWPSGFIALIGLLVLLASSLSEALGVHAFLGAFLIGVALGDEREQHKEAHDVIGHFVMSFAPIYFISMGMSTNFIVSFDPVLVALILVVACISKVGAVLLGAKAAGMPLDREAWAIAFGLNARGATGIILAGVGLANGVIDARIFVAIVVTALITSLMAGPVMSRFLWSHQATRIRHMKPTFLASALLVLAVGLCAVTALDATQAPRRAARDHRQWPAYGGGPEQTRYSSLDHINRSNVSRLALAWSWDSGEEGGLQTNPIVVEGVLYATTPKHKVVALDAATGSVKWTFDPRVEGRGPNRGVMYWSSGNDRRIFAASQHFVYALDARTGVVVQSFGREGRIDLRADLGRAIGQQSVSLTTPGVIYRDLLIVGGRVGEGDGASPGHIRAYDARSGRLRWRFHTIPQPGEVGYETWSKDSWTTSGGANSWAGMALDDARGIVYVPTGSAAPDFYGGDRAGENLFANTLLALNAGTGARVWHFQAVRHDIWDRDFPSPPTLVTVTRGGRRIDAIAQTTKHGYVFLFDRATGTPLFPIEERAYPSSGVEGEVTARTQPLPTRPAPFARQTLTEDLLTTRTPVAHAWALERFRSFAGGSPFVPFRVGQETIIFPGFDGGAEWGGSAFDPQSGVLYVNANDLAWTGGLAPNEPRPTSRSLYLKECAVCHRDDFKGTPPAIPSLEGIASRRSTSEMVAVIRTGAGRMPGFPNLSDESVAAIVEFMRSGRSAAAASGDDDPPARASRYRFTGYKKFLDPEGYPAVAPPWGTLNAIDLNTGEYVWKIPLGEYPELAAKGVKDTGTENYGGPIVTAGGLVFIGATNFDRKFRAFDKGTGALLWETTLPFGGNATPATYDVNGRQFVVIAAGGGRSKAPSGGVYVAFALQ